MFFAIHMLSLNPGNGHMALLAGTGLAIMSLSWPGRKLARFLAPASFVAGLALVVWGLLRPGWEAEIGLALLLLVGWAIERRPAKEPTAPPELAATESDEEVRSSFVDTLARWGRVMELEATVPTHGTDEDYFKTELPNACRQVLDSSQKIRKMLAERCGYDVGLLYESDRGIDARYDGPNVPTSAHDLDLFVQRRVLRIEEIIREIRRGAIAVAPAPQDRGSADTNVLVRYTTTPDPNLGIRFLFPNEANTSGPIVLAPGHGRVVRWHIEVINNLPTDVPSVGFNILLPAALVPSLKSAGSPSYSVHEVPERMIRDGDKGSLCLSGDYGPLRGRGWTTAFAFDIGVHYAREIPVKVKISSDQTGEVEYCAPIIGVLEPIRGA
jgi:hypothetical protein